MELREIFKQKGNLEMDYQDITCTKEEGIATLTLNRPDRMNAFSPEMIQSIFKVVKDANKDEKVRVLVITGAGRAFCTGSDVSAMAQRFDQFAVEESKSESTDAGLTILLQRFEKPIIAAINGAAVAGGLDLACACDIRIASDRATFAMVYVRRGMIPTDGGTFLLPRLIGIDRACQLIWTGDRIDAREAERIGLVTTVVPHEELQSAARELAEKLAKGPPLVIQKAKRAIYEGTEMDMKSALKHIASAVRILNKTADFEEGLKAFVEKREPVFKGR